jgi:hypothetical protein
MIADHDLVKKSFGPMIADHDLVKKRQTIMEAEVSTHTFLTMIIEESVCFMSCEPFFFAIILMWFKSWVTHRSLALLCENTELSAVKYFVISS